MSLSSLKLIFYQKSFTKEENACQNAFTSFDNIHQLQIFACIQTQQKPEIYLFLYVTTIPTTEAKKAIGASLTNKNSNPCIIVPATANSGSL